MNRESWVIAVVWMLLAGCQAPLGQLKETGLNTEAMIFSKVAGANRVDKTAWLNSDTARASYQIASPETDIEPLRILDQLNKPVFRSSYSDSVYGNTTSNLQVRELTARDSSASVRRLRIYFPASTGIPLIMDAQVVHDNLLFSKREFLEIRFDLTGSRIDRYRLSGVQKTIFNAPVMYGAGVEFYY